MNTKTLMIEDRQCERFAIYAIRLTNMWTMACGTHFEQACWILAEQITALKPTSDNSYGTCGWQEQEVVSVTLTKDLPS